jgi:hypothetical protein
MYCSAQAKLSLLFNDVLELKPEKFMTILLKSRVADPLMLASIVECKQELFSGSQLLTILLNNSKQDFLKSYAEALDLDIIVIQDPEMIGELTNIINDERISHANIIAILKASGLKADTYKDFGRFMHSFCQKMSMADGKVLDYVEDGE